jgi:penicillin-insensitive murein endopeptidase
VLADAPRGPSRESWPFFIRRDSSSIIVRIAYAGSIALSTALTLSTGAVPGAPPRPHTVARVSSLGPAALRFGRSIGSPTEGHLLGGMHLDETVYLRIVPTYVGADVRWGLEPLVQMIDRAARQVRRQYPDSITSVGHLSREGGGEIDRHRSHESGRDADIAFFVRNASGRQLLPSHFVPFRGDGTANEWAGAKFDDAKNWALVEAMVGDPEAHVTHIFVAAPLRARLLAYAERNGVPAATRIRAAEVLQQPRGALPHDDHFHVRIGCPTGMSGCVENPALRARHGGPAGIGARPRPDETEDVPYARGRRPPPLRGILTAPPRAHPTHTPDVHPSPPEEVNPPPEPAPAAIPAVPNAVDDVDG